MLGALLAAAMTTTPVSAARIVERSWEKTLVVGHRGAAAHKPENTLESFREAIRSGAVATECDVHTDRDGGVVVIHDTTLHRTTALKGMVSNTPSALLRRAGVPFLEDYTRVTKDRIVSVIEIKAGVEVEAKVARHLRAHNMVDQSIVFSFDASRVAKTKEADRGLRAIWLVASPGTPADYEERVFSRLKDIGADGVGVQFRNATPELAAEARKRRIPLFVWTVPPGPEVDRLKALRVNFVITDHPAEVIAQLGRTPATGP
jgi:glycerophosphoryl diester phosphodiesterase